MPTYSTVLATQVRFLATLAGGAKSVTNADVSQPALDLAKHHVAINGLDENKANYVNQDVFKALRGITSRANSLIW